MLSYKERKRVAEAANKASDEQRVQQGDAYVPVVKLSVDSSRSSLISWLRWCDPNGAHSDENARHEGSEPYTLETAWDAVRAMFEDV